MAFAALTCLLLTRLSGLALQVAVLSDVFACVLGSIAGKSEEKGGASSGFLAPEAPENALDQEDSIATFAHDIESRVVAVSDSPRIYLVDDFLSDQECDYMRAHGAPHLQPSLVVNRATGEYYADTVRTNMQMYVTKEDSRDNPVIANIIRRMHRFVRIPIGHGEQIQIGRYQVGQKYDCHFDSEVSVNVIRPATLIVYLADNITGGDTVFPMGKTCQPLHLCCEGNDTAPARLFHPKKGRAILFYSHDLDGALNRQAVHGSCPVKSGEKWIIQAWFRSTLYPESPHYVFEQGMIDGQAAEL